MLFPHPLASKAASGFTLFTRCLPLIFNGLANTTATLGSFYWLGFETSGLSPDKKRLAWLGAQQLDLIDAALAGESLTDRDLAAADYLSPGDVAKVKQAMRKIEPPTAEVHASAWDLLLANRETFYDPGIKDSDYAAKWNDLRAEVIGMIPTAYRGDINSELAARSPANRNAARVKPPRDLDMAELKNIGVDRISRARAAGMFGDVSDEAAPPIREKAYRRAEELRLKVSQWINANPKAAIQEVSDFTDSLISGDRVKSSAVDLRQFIPGSAQRLRPAPAMQPLPPKSGDKANPDPLQLPPGDGAASDALLPARQLENFINSDQ